MNFKIPYKWESEKCGAKHQTATFEGLQRSCNKCGKEFHQLRVTEMMK